MSGSLRDQMPYCAAFIDELRAAFGKTEIDASIKRGLRPDCKPVERFYADEAGHVLGHRFVPSVEVGGKDLVVRLPDQEPVVKTRGRR